MVGDHSAATFRPLWDAISVWQCYFWVSDGNPVYPGFIPDGDQIVAEVQIRPGDIDGLAVGMPAQIRFTSFNQVETPVRHGQVLSISADRLIAPKTGAPYYGMRVLVDAGSGEGLAISPGMPASLILRRSVSI